ncbi:MAG TPA: ABC-F family ATP-binding cassette domain-containing protein [Solirubrobacterales bacterium]|nr:ABC-F family ATP-binding cassette domain-containing protein [Solirubrobacterales bacterium]
MATITASGLSKHVGAQALFRDVAFKLEVGDRMTLAGRNGSGKTTLLRIIAGEAGADGGTISITRGARVALHDQRSPREAGTLREYVTSALSWIEDIEAELAQLERRMAGGDSSPETLAAYAEAQARLEHAGGYRWRDGAEVALRGLGFGDDELERSLESFSGGELTRASLARALTSKPDLLLLDEPTNHLDIESLEWLERYLGEVDAAVILVAHDRWFLETVGTSVFELEGGRGRFFSGPWHAWRAEQATRELAAGRDAARRQAEIARMQRFVERFRYKATKARQAQSKLKAIDRLKAGMPAAEPSDGRSLTFSFGDAGRSGRVVLELEGGRIEVPGRALIEDGDLWLERGEHVCLVGPNGTGKTTLVETLAGARELPSGKLRRGHNVKLGYLSQHTDLGGTPQTTMLAHAQHATGLSEAKTRALLGGFLFSGEEVLKTLRELSGGEAQRLALAILTSSDANLLILDEPTNHLDLESREALEDALQRYAGTLLLISHDRALLEAVGRRTIALDGGRLRSYPGGWVEYRRAEERARADAREPRRASRKPPRSAGPSKNRRAELERLEREAEVADAALAQLEGELADPAHWSTPARAEKSTRRHERARRARDDAYARWEAAAEAAERI